jgi:hypothetical protein
MIAACMTRTFSSPEIICFRLSFMMPQQIYALIRSASKFCVFMTCGCVGAGNNAHNLCERCSTMPH